MAETYDVIVAGSGPAGGHVARKCREEGLSVAVIEQDGWGGVCPLRGCEPKKTLVEAAHAVDAIERMNGNGVKGQVSIDWGDLIRFKREFTAPVSESVENSMRDAGIVAHQGRCVFTGTDSVEVRPGNGGEPVRLQGRRICLAVGARPRPFSFPGAGLMVDSAEFLELESLPSTAVFIGGGYVSFEFTLVAMAAGCDATLVTHGERFLRAFDPELVDTLLDLCREKGLSLHENFSPARVERKGDAFVLYGEEGDDRSFEAGLIVNGAGRVPSTDGMELEKGEVSHTKGAIAVDDTMRSVSSGIVYAAGDCTDQGWPLTPVATHQADVAARNILRDLGKGDGEPARVDYVGIASALFSDPPLARTGLLEREAEEQAREQGYALKRYKGDASEWSEYRRIGRRHAGYNVLVREDTGCIVGAHFLGEGAEELASVAGLAIRHGISVKELMKMLWAYPSFAYTLRYVFR